MPVDPIYATLTDMQNMGLPPTFLASVPNAAQLAALSVRSRWADSHLRAQFTLPLIQWGDDLTFAVVSLASYDVAIRRGYNQEAGADSNIAQRAHDAQRWLDKVASGALVPSVTDSTSGASEGITDNGPMVGSGIPQGWSDRGTGQQYPFGFQGS